MAYPHAGSLSAYLLTLTLTLALVLLMTVEPNAATDIWPTDAWPTATPESQGLDAGVLAEMLEHVRARNLPLHSVLILRHGRLVLDATFYPYRRGDVHDIASATKSVTSLLIGMALDKGYLKTVHQPVADLLSPAAPAGLDPARPRPTIEHLLTMTSGWHCGVEPGEKELAAMRRSGDWAAFALALPMWAEPGTRYAYCSCNNHVLSAIVSAQTGDSALAFARTHLFGPLGIKDAVWPADPKGRSHGWGDLLLHPHDLAKIAYLYLHGGRWNGRQVVSEAWVRESIVPRVPVRDGVAYGYGWWINTARTPPVFEATGRGGQRAAVLPDKDLVVVFNSGGVNTDELAPFLFRAIRSDAPLPENPGQTTRLRKRIEEARQASSTTRNAAPLPSLARAVSGTRYVIEDNPMTLQRLSLKFSGRSVAHATLRLSAGEWTVPIGLDGRSRVSSTGPSGVPMAAMGRWLSPREFLLDLDTVANINHFTIHMQFGERDVQLRINETTGEIKDLDVLGRAETTVP